MPGGNRTPNKAEVSRIKTDEGALKEELSIEELQSHLMGFADDFSLAMMHSATMLEAVAQTPEERSRIRQWKLSHINAAMVLAAGPNPPINLVDLAGMATLGRQAFEHDWVPVFGERANQMVEVHKRYEKEIWELVERILKPEPLQQLREIIAEWVETHPEKRFGAFVGLSDYAKARYQSPERVRTQSGGNLLTLFSIDPMAKLDPAMRQLEQTRYFAERSMFYAQRLPSIVRLQMELLLSEFGAAPEVQRALKNVNEFREVAQHFNQIMERLPERVGSEQRKVMDDLFGRKELKDKLGDFAITFTAAKSMAESVEQASRSIATLTAQFGKTNENRRPFDVMDYAVAAEKIDQTAGHLASTLDSLDRVVRSPGWAERVSDVSAVMGRTEEASQRLIDRAFRLGLLLVGAVLAAALIYRFVARYAVSRKG
jgi:hypothetical protein